MIDASSGIEKQEYEVVYYNIDNEDVILKKRSWFTTQVFYKIDGTTLYLRATSADGYTERVMYEDKDLAKTGWYTAATKTAITTCVIEEDIVPSACARMFDGMTKLSTFEGFEKLHVDNATSMRTMFQYCSGLASLDLSSWDTSNVTDMSYMFYDCNNLTSFGDISNWNVSNVTNMFEMFCSCHALTSLGDLSNWNVSNVTDMGHMFSSCYELEIVENLNKWDTSNVTNMRSMFQYCSGLVSLNLTDWDTSNVTDMGYMFNQCNSLTSVGDLSNWDTSKVTNMYYMFNQTNSIVTHWVKMEGTPPIPKGCNANNMFCDLGKLATIEKCGTISASVSLQWSSLTHDTALVLLNALDNENIGTLTLSTATYSTLSADDIKIATDKSWIITQG